MSREESLPLLSFLYQQVTRPEYSFVLAGSKTRWRCGTTAVSSITR